MSIPESQLETWSRHVEARTLGYTQNAIRTALAARLPQGLDGKYEVFLQGSYRNDTNVYADSDVDLVVQLNSTFNYDITDLSWVDASNFENYYPTRSNYQWSQFRDEVLSALRSYYGPREVEEGNHALNVVGNPGARMPADVVICLEYRKYRSFAAGNPSDYAKGIVFYTRHEGRMVVNFPKEHLEAGWAKNAATDGWYKKTVRIFKNARGRLLDSGLLPDGWATGYFLESLLFNVPEPCYGGGHDLNFHDVLDWLNANTHLFGSFICQNGQIPLFGPAHEQWEGYMAGTFLSRLTHLDVIWT